MKTHKAKRVAIIIEAPMESRLTDALEKAGVTGYSILPVLGGSGRSGSWRRDGQVGRAGGMVQVVSIVKEERLETLLNAAFEMVEHHMGVVTVSDCEVLRAERF
ncbi:MAG: transcriptional regulator [Pseudomonadota bacterium]